jgi:TRAP-type C4-dicarboxylate transport system permease small subunit
MSNSQKSPGSNRPSFTNSLKNASRSGFLVVSLLAFPLSFLLFAQWPLRELVQAGSRLANDLGQIIFAIYVSVAITAASRSGSHLASASQEHAGKQPVARWRIWALFLCLAPWAVFMLWAGWPVVANSLLSLEHFGETMSPGYFLIKLAMLLMVVLVLIDVLLQLRPAGSGNKP